MKRLTLVRHGHAEWKDQSIDDFQRPLNKRGLRESESIARRMLELDWSPDLLVASSAERTRTTAEILAKTLNPKHVQFEEKLYLASAADILSTIRAADPSAIHLMLVGHNPGISEVVQLLAPEGSGQELNTACACSVVIRVKEWSEVGPGLAIEAAYETPSMLSKLWA